MSAAAGREVIVGRVARARVPAPGVRSERPTRAPSAETGDIFVEPGTVAQRMTELDASAKALDRDIAASKVADSFKQGWADWFARWRRYYQDLNDGSFSSWFKRWQSGTVTQVERDELEFSEWRKRFLADGGTATGPDLPEHPKTLEKTVSDIAKALLLGAAAVGGLVLVVNWARK
jgi:hypothetical protein